MDEDDPVTNRVFFLGAGFSKPAGLPLAVELLDLVREVVRETLSVDGYNHLDHAIGRYKDYLRDIDPSRAFDLEEFGAWLDWEFVLRLRGSDTFSEHGNQAALQLRWGIGKVLHELTPTDIPPLYLDFAGRLTTSDHVMTPTTTSWWSGHSKPWNCRTGAIQVPTVRCTSTAPPGTRPHRRHWR